MSESEIDTFVVRMRKATRKIHSVSDTLVNAKFVLSLHNEKVWSGGLLVFYHIFAYLEDASIRLKNSDMNSLFANKILLRKQAFEEDLQHYLGDQWRSIEKPESLKNYLQHLEDLEKNNPQLLMAYVYHLYMGLLSGGKILAKKRKIFGESKQDFYVDKVTDFKENDIPELKTGIREATNRLAEKMTKEEQQAFIDESIQVFLLNNAIVDSVGGQNQVIWNYLWKISVLIIVIGIAYKVCK